MKKARQKHDRDEIVRNLAPGTVYSTPTHDRAALTLRRVTVVDPVRGLIRSEPFPVPRSLAASYVTVPRARGGIMLFESARHAVVDIFPADDPILRSPEPAPKSETKVDARIVEATVDVDVLAARLAEILLPKLRGMVAEGVQDGYGRL